MGREGPREDPDKMALKNNWSLPGKESVRSKERTLKGCFEERAQAAAGIRKGNVCLIPGSILMHREVPGLQERDPKEYKKINRKWQSGFTC